MHPANEFRLPDLGEGLTDAELVRWSVAVGDIVALDQVIAEVETAKALVELPSPFAGTVLALLAEPGTIVEVGAPLIRIGEPGAAATPAAEPPDHPATLVGYGPTAPPPSRRRRATPKAPPTTADRDDARPDATPSARRLAHELGVDLSTVNGTGFGGAITPEDIRAQDVSRKAPLPEEATPPRETRTPIRGVRRQTADAMTRSAFTAPHVTEFVTVDVSASTDLIAHLRASPAFADLEPTPLALVAKVLLVSLRDHPTLNSSWDEAHQEIVTRHYVNLGIATATSRGLLVPTVKDAHLMSLLELTRAIHELTETARAGRCTPADLSGGTITITNVGVFGVDTGTPILSPGEAAILCLGAIAPRPWVVDGELAVRSVTTLGLSFDHRLVDGEQGSRFLVDIAATLGDPLSLL
ncbi:dihydrolipoamide acetyltransferase family protein [Rhodococcus maanshanensis]|uniref:Dihydrolipoamide acetyltransferase component of pyruvate dehydrogenase complex n=1 Tax=Rhodococcus maanshanensis TaxID=183556 RepID=A0A1H7PHT4_9NOCA|nr:dihydrolipoamide acetyltransferase family protein [Rhodococcus maanshanensis]SEL34845.1 pyruvate dehydrogenase E2 component (dihydrolipoamide acetyltransferase) [Rhodococcus maanshanensis]